MQEPSSKPGPSSWGRPTTNFIALQAQELKEQFVELRKQRYTFAQISHTLGISKTRAHQIIKETLQEGTEQWQVEAKAMIEIEVESLDLLKNTAWEVFHSTQNLKLCLPF